MSIQPIGLCGEGITTVTTGAALLLRGERIAFGTAASKGRRDIPLQINLTAAGVATSTGTIKVEMSPDGSSWTQVGSSWAVTIPAGGKTQQQSPAPLTFKMTGAYDYVRVNVTAISGVTFQGWVKRMD